MAKVLVTGANGFLASNVIAELLSKGYAVRGVLRNANSFSYHTHPDLELVQGDFTDKNFLEKVMKGCDYVIHTAAITDQSLTGFSEYHRVNVAAAENLIRIAIKEKARRFVYVGSANAFGHGTKKKPGNEQTPIRKPFTGSHYAMSKLQGQQAVLAYSGKIEVVVLNPTFMLGPYDSKPGSGKIILMGYGKKFIFYPPGGKNFVHVQDVATGVVNALEKGRNGETYLLANENLSYKEFFQKLADVTKNKTVLIKIPGPVLLTIGFAGNLLRFFGFRTALSLANMKILCAEGFYSKQKATDELGIESKSIEKAIKDTIEWFAGKGLIKAC